MNLTRTAVLSAGLALLTVGSAQAQHFPIQYPNVGGQPLLYPQLYPQQPQLMPFGGYPGYSNYQPAAPVAPVHQRLRDRDVERAVEQAVCAAFGPWLDDVDVDADVDDCEVEVEIELERCVPGLEAQICAYVRQLPILTGFRVEIDIDD